MSISLVKKSLQLIESSKFQNKRKLKSESEKLTKPAIKRLKGEKSKVTSRNVNIIKTFQKLQKQLEEKSRNDKTEENLQKLIALSDTSEVDDKKALQFFARATKSKKVKVEKVEKVDTTIFTEEDFARFEREYVYE